MDIDIGGSDDDEDDEPVKKTSKSKKAAPKVRVLALPFLLTSPDKLRYLRRTGLLESRREELHRGQITS